MPLFTLSEGSEKYKYIHIYRLEIIIKNNLRHPQNWDKLFFDFLSNNEIPTIEEFNIAFDRSNFALPDDIDYYVGINSHEIFKTN